jgi:hypothetical protein
MMFTSHSRPHDQIKGIQSTNSTWTAAAGSTPLAAAPAAGP